MCPIDDAGIRIVAHASTGNSNLQFIFRVGTTPCETRAGSIRCQAHNDEKIVPAVLLICEEVDGLID